MRKLLLALVALALAAGLGFTLGRSSERAPLAVAWAQKFVKDPRVAGKLVLAGAELEGVVGVAGLEELCEVVEEIDPRTGQVRKRPGKKAASNLRLTLSLHKVSSLAMQKWFEQTHEGALERKNGSVILFDRESGNEVLRYDFYEGWPCKWYVPELDSDQSGMAIGKIELAVEKVERA